MSDAACIRYSRHKRDKRPIATATNAWKGFVSPTQVQFGGTFNASDRKPRRLVGIVTGKFVVSGLRVMTCRQVAISPRVRRFSHADACRIFDSALDQRGSSLVLIDMSEIDEATTSAFARLVLLRRMLIREGRDMRLTGLRDRAAMLYEISRLQSVLPCC